MAEKNGCIMKLRNKIFVISRVFGTSVYFIRGFKIHEPVVSSDPFFLDESRPLQIIWKNKTFQISNKIDIQCRL